ncbi:hypothetical protein GW17_00008741 [Ensete ventricosum]|nr:hypothetical protein GW17_00008741 [Ensete ventricosum]
MVPVCIEEDSGCNWVARSCSWASIAGSDNIGGEVQNEATDFGRSASKTTERRWPWRVPLPKPKEALVGPWQRMKMRLGNKRLGSHGHGRRGRGCSVSVREEERSRLMQSGDDNYDLHRSQCSAKFDAEIRRKLALVISLASFIPERYETTTEGEDEMLTQDVLDGRDISQSP